MPGPIQCRGVFHGKECEKKFSTLRGETKHAKKCCPDLVGTRGGNRVRIIAPALGK
jgi:hypothetical protein